MNAHAKACIETMPAIDMVGCEAVPVWVYLPTYEEWKKDIAVGVAAVGSKVLLVEYADRSANYVRVRVTHPQGFGYALGVLWRTHEPNLTLARVTTDGTHMGSLASRHWYGTTTDADHLAVARACQDVSP